MPPRKRARPTWFRVGRVSSPWCLVAVITGTLVSPSVARASRRSKKRSRSRLKSMPKVSSGVPTLLAFTPISLSELRDLFLAHHEHVLKSSVATVRRYRAATKHIQDFIERQRKPLRAHEVRPDSLRL